MERELIREWSDEHHGFRLEMFDTFTRDDRGQTRMAYRFFHEGKLIFDGADFCGSPMHADDSDETVAALGNQWKGIVS